MSALSKGLGRGLQSLLSANPTVSASRGDGTLPIALLQAGAFQPRRKVHRQPKKAAGQVIDFSQRLEVDGFVVIPGVTDDSQCEALASQLEAFERIGAGSRTLLMQSWCGGLARALRENTHLRDLLPVDTVAVQNARYSISRQRRIGWCHCIRT